ncbi:MAG TPA: ABC transporter ATP-binding protein [Gemmataceae bacterium]|nr:ABC transporter ATP-binding protein [Gemmataceae bacterium]
MPDIRITDVHKTYSKGVVALQPLSLHVQDGSHFVLLGPSGSGKTTLLRLIAGLETAEGGTIFFGERAVHALPAHERRVALVAQRSALYPDRDVRGNVASGLEFGRDRADRTEISRRVHEAAEMLGIGNLLARRPHELSGGEQRRVILARALVRRCDVYLLDEPLGQLDAPLAAKLSHDLHLLQRQLRLTIVHVTHDPNEAMALADRVGLLGDGRLLQTGIPDEVYTHPSSRTVGLHFGRPPINLIDGVGDGATFVSADEWLRLPCPHSGELTLGIRPADVCFEAASGLIRVANGMAGRARRIDDRFLVPVHGPSTEVCGLVGDVPTTARLDLWFRIDRLHWFDRATGLRVGGSIQPQ